MNERNHDLSQRKYDRNSTHLTFAQATHKISIHQIIECIDQHPNHNRHAESHQSFGDRRTAQKLKFVSGLGKSQMGAISIVFPLGQVVVG